MSDETRWAVDTSNVIHDILEGEVIAMRIDKGLYYSLAGTGAEIWDLLVQGHTTDGVVEVLSSRYEAESGVIAKAVADLVAELRAEELLAPASESAGAQAPEPAERDDRAERASFAPPELHAYADMQDLLLLDPIHDVDETGWPSPQ